MPVLDWETGKPITYERWRDVVDRYCWAWVGCSIDDLPDQPYRDWYEGDMYPKEAAREALREAGWRE